MGHMWDTLYEGVDIILTLKKNLFLRILWVDCHKIWHGVPLVIELKHREKKMNCHGFGWRKMKL